jgi:uncharacterized caspase-like protein
MSEKRRALIVANFDYQDPALRRLTAPARDAEELARVLENPAIGGFEVKTLLNEKAATVSQAVEDFFVFADPKPDDFLLLYFSGHGITDEEGQLYFATTDTQLVRQTVRRASAVGAEFVDAVMRRSRSRRQVLLLDCCHSGAFAGGMRLKGELPGLATHFQGKGRMVLTASTGTQFSLEGSDEPEGQPSPSVYTRILTRGLETGEADLHGDGQIDIDELHEYLLDRLQTEGHQQTPTKSGYLEGQLYVARAAVVRPAELPRNLQNGLKDPEVLMRLGAVQWLEELLLGEHPGLALAAWQALAQVRENDDSLRVRRAAESCLASHDARKASSPEVERPATDKAEAAPKLADEHGTPPAQRERMERAEERKLASQKAEAERLAVVRLIPPLIKKLAAQKAEAERLAVERAEAERQTREKAERERLAREAAETERTKIAAAQAERESSTQRADESWGRVTAEPIPMTLTAPEETSPARLRWIIAGAVLVVAAVVMMLRSSDHPGAPSSGEVSSESASQPGPSAVIPPPGAPSVADKGTSGASIDAVHLELVRTLKQQTPLDRAFGVAFSPDGALLASAWQQVAHKGEPPLDFRGNGSIRLWDVSTGALVRTMQPAGEERPDDEFASVAFGPNGRHLAASTSKIGHGAVSLWDVNTGKMLALANATGEFRHLTFSPDGSLIAAACGDGSVHIFDAGTLELLKVLKHPYIVVSVAFNPLDGWILAAGDYRQSVRVWDVLNGNSLRVLRSNPPSYGEAVAFSPDGKTLVSGHASGALISWDFRTGAMLWKTQFAGSGVDSIAFSPDGQLLAAEGRSKLRVWDAAQHELLGTFDISDQSYSVSYEAAVVAFHPHQHLLATTIAGDSIQLWSFRIDRASR